MGVRQWLNQLTAKPGSLAALRAFLEQLYGRDAVNALELYHREHRYWPPTDKNEPVLLYRIQTGADQPAIAMASPIAYVFKGMKYDNLPIEKLILMYMGWHVCYSLVSNPKHPWRKQGTDREAFLEQLRDDGWRADRVEEEILIAQTNYYTAKIYGQAVEQLAAGYAGQYWLYDPALPEMQRPLYYHIGWGIDQSGA